MMFLCDMIQETFRSNEININKLLMVCIATERDGNSLQALPFTRHINTNKLLIDMELQVRLNFFHSVSKCFASLL